MGYHNIRTGILCILVTENLNILPYEANASAIFVAAFIINRLP